MTFLMISEPSSVLMSIQSAVFASSIPSMFLEASKANQVPLAMFILFSSIIFEHQGSAIISAAQYRR